MPPITMEQWDVLREARDQYLSKGIKLPPKMASQLSKVGLDPAQIENRFLKKPK